MELSYLGKVSSLYLTPFHVHVIVCMSNWVTKWDRAIFMVPLCFAFSNPWCV